MKKNFSSGKSFQSNVWFEKEQLCYQKCMGGDSNSEVGMLKEWE